MAAESYRRLDRSGQWSHSMETEWNQETAAESDADSAQADATADLELAIGNALCLGMSAREIRKIVKEVVEYHGQGDRNI